MCKGVGLVDAATWIAYQAKKAARTTSSTTPIRHSVVASLTRLKMRATPQLQPLITVGEGLLETIDGWQTAPMPAEGAERGRVYERVTDWLMAADSVLKNER